MKMYILIKDICPDNIAPLMAAHAVMGAYNKFEDDALMQEWRKSPHFKKVVCKVNHITFEAAKKQGAYVVLSENHHENLGEIAMAFNIQEEYSKFFKFLTMWKVDAR